MTSKERVLASLRHQQPDRVPMDFGGSAVTGMHVSVVAGLRDHYGLEKRPVKVHEPYQMLGWVDEDLKQAMGLDGDGVIGRKTLFGFVNENWKPWRTHQGLEVLVSGNFNTTIDANGDTVVRKKRKLSLSGLLHQAIFMMQAAEHIGLHNAVTGGQLAPMVAGRNRVLVGFRNSRI